MISEEALRLAAQRAGQTLTDSLPDPETCDHEFSPAFEKKMKRLMNRDKYAGVYRGLKRVACFFLAVLLSGSVWLSVDAEAREAFFGWLNQKLDGDYHYFFSGNDTVSPEDIQYVLPEVPEGYEPYNHYEDEKGFVRNIYANDDGLAFRFEYLIGNSSEMFLSDQGIGEPQIVYVHGKPAEFYPSINEGTSSTLVWHDRETDTLLCISGFFGEEYLVGLAESVEQKEK